MAKERLSKLQRWILTETYKLNILHDGSVVGRDSCGFYLRGPDGPLGNEFAYQYFEVWIYEKYYGLNCWYGNGATQTPEYKKAHVTVWRSVGNLEKKGLISVLYWFRKRTWSITEKGIAALKLPPQS
jgi:hypothetical protein